MIRREIREKAFMFLFQLELQKGDEEKQLAGFIEEYEIDQASSEYFNILVQGVTANQAELDNCFIPYLKGWTKERLPRVDLTIIRLASYEMLHIEEVPDSVAISEAVLLAKKFSSEESRSYINAVLGRLSREKDQVLARIKEAKENEIKALEILSEVKAQEEAQETKQDE